MDYYSITFNDDMTYSSPKAIWVRLGKWYVLTWRYVHLHEEMTIYGGDL